MDWSAGGAIPDWRSCCELMIVLSPSRKTGWSSTLRTRIRPGRTIAITQTDNCNEIARLSERTRGEALSVR